MHGFKDKLDLDMIYEVVKNIVSNPLYMESLIAETEKQILNKLDFNSIKLELIKKRESFENAGIKFELEIDISMVKEYGRADALIEIPELDSIEEVKTDI